MVLKTLKKKFFIFLILKKKTEKKKFYIQFYNAVENPQFYNIAEGGQGGNTIAGYSKEEREQINQKISEGLKGHAGLYNAIKKGTIYYGYYWTKK